MDITYAEASRLLLEVFLEVAAKKYLLADNKVASLLETFIAALPVPLQEKLLPCA